MSKKIILALFIAIIQFFLFAGLYDLITLGYKYYYHISKIDNVNWGITLHYTFLFYCIITIVTNVLVAVKGLNTFTRITCLAMILAFDVFLMNNFHSMPYKTLLLIVISNGLFILTFYADKFFKLKKTKNL